MTDEASKTREELLEEISALQRRLSAAEHCSFQKVADEFPQFLFESDAEGRLLYTNRHAMERFHCTREDLHRGLLVSDLIHESEHERLWEEFAQAIRGAAPESGNEYRAVSMTGEIFPIRVYSRPVIQDGRSVGLRGVFIDISEIKQVENALRTRETHYRTTFENTGTAMVVITGDGRLHDCNEMFAVLSGYSREEIENRMSWMDFVAPEYAPLVGDLRTRRLAQEPGLPTDYEIEIITREGKHIPIHLFVRATPERQELICSLIDVSERDATLKALQESDERFRLVTGGANDGIWDWDLRTNEVYYSPRYMEILGYSREEFPCTADSWLGKIHPDDIKRTLVANERCMQGKSRQFQVEFRMRHKDGSYRWILGRGGNNSDESGKVVRMSGTHTDITARKLTERTTRALYAISSAVNSTMDLLALYRSIHQSIGEVIWAENFFIARYEDKSDSLRFVYYKDQEELGGEVIDNVSRSDETCLTLHVFRTGRPLLLNKTDPMGASQLEAIGVRGTPPEIWLGVPLKSGENVIGVMAVWCYHTRFTYRDEDLAFLNAVSEQVAMAIEHKIMEEALTRLNAELESKVAKRTRELQARTTELERANKRLLKLDEIKSSLVSSVSHELRTPLTSIRGFARLCHRDFSRHFKPLAKNKPLHKMDKRIRENLRIIEIEGERLTRLISDFLDINRIESGKTVWNDEPMDPAEAVLKSVNVAFGGFSADHQVKLITRLATDRGRVMADPDKFQQVMVNLLNNAHKFTLQGTVTVATGQRDKDVVVTVSDTGIGIPEDEIPYIFERFHKSRLGDTLLSPTKGTGLGLAICKEIVEHYGGSIWVESEEGKGSAFSFALPLMKEN